MTFKFTDVKIIRHNLEGAKAATGMDNRGRVLIVVSDKLPKHWRVVYSLWGLYHYLKMKLKNKPCLGSH